MTKQFRCPVCGYVHTGDTAPDFCPVCKAPGDSFVEITQDAKHFASEHVVGIAAGVDMEVLEGLRMNFAGECTEVGMYLAMARVAEREGYTEVAEAFKRYSFEEAEHASRFAELLGEVNHLHQEKPETARSCRIRRMRRQNPACQACQGAQPRRDPRHRARDGAGRSAPRSGL